MSEKEAVATLDAHGLVPLPGSMGPKWVSIDAPQSTLRLKGHEKTVVFEVDSGTKAWLDSLGVNFLDLDVGEKGLPGGVFKKLNEEGAYGIGVSLLELFNSKVRRITIR